MAGPLNRYRRSVSSPGAMNVMSQPHWDDDYHDSLEVTREEFEQGQHKNKPPGIPGRRLLKSLRNQRYRQHQPPNHKRKPSRRDRSDDNASIASSVIGGSSVKSLGGTSHVSATGGITVASNDDTVLVSNRKLKSLLKESGSEKKKPWKTLKRIITGSSKHSVSDRTLETESPPSAASPFSLRERARSEAGPSRALLFDEPQVDRNSRKRFDSAPSFSRKKKHHDQNDVQTNQDMMVLLKREQSLLDDAIRGRLDGMDTLSLGPARVASIPRSSHNAEDEMLQSMTYSLKRSPRAIVSDMIWTSSGKDQPEMVLEGFIPAGDDRWMVRVEADPPSKEKRRGSHGSNKSARSTTTPVSSPDDVSSTHTSAFDSCASSLCGSVERVQEALSPTSTPRASPTLFFSPYEEDDDDDEDGTPVHVLLKSMWGNSPPPPTHMSRASTESSLDDDDNDVLQMAASCSVPIDIDEDTFIIDNAAHLQSVHDICAGPLKSGQYDNALQIFRKILKGVQLNSPRGNDSKTQSGNVWPSHLVGSTLHNIGIVQMWQGNYQDAVDSFEQAVVSREKCLPKNHPDVAVSYMREGVALFCLESFDMAVQSFQRALSMIKTENATRAKLLNNLGVAHYHKQDFVEALAAFTAALEIQRVWLEGPVRRASIVFDASITLSNMGKLYMERKDYDTALYVYEEALLLQTTSFRKDHDVVLVSLGNLAYAKAKNGNYQKALQIYKGLLRSQDTKYGRQSSQAMETVGLMGLLHAQLKQHKMALKCLKALVKWQVVNLNALNPAIRRTKDKIKTLERCKILQEEKEDDDDNKTESNMWI